MRVSRSLLWCAAPLALAVSGCSGAPSTPGDAPTDPAAGSPSATSSAAEFDLQAHRGGRGETTEESLAGFEKSIRLGVTTLELDVVLTKDGVPAVWHDPTVLETKCSDTGPATPGDRQYPYVGKLVHDLTWAQLRTLDCSKTLKEFPDAQSVPGNKIARLRDVFALTDRLGSKARYNIETKIEAAEPEKSATPEDFVDVILAEVDAAHVADRVSIQSFDWRSLPLVKKKNPAIPTALLWDETTWLADSPWTAGVSVESVKGDIVAAAKKVDADVLSPGYSLPYGRRPGDADFRLVADKAFVDRAHAAGLTVVPWTVNDPEAMKAQIDAGVDGIITDYPGRLRTVMEERGMTVPPPGR
ncbi:glycerophosphodiester phosphodiesterase [Mobilicoccus pelagius]|uniref:Putative esterase n=1 Tax=Mobilicoccus pelagius NBRC 104925 TaxID=1089455 RepID=H5UNP6_9MICO|nr:glycerophosphodiester phosphodiesterase [Mobilicoccus pelagius]GAB47354.1 putative esterase [Mobilicoccus pelagius NBRC 104925]